MKRLGLVALTAVLGAAAGGCGMSTAVRGTPVPAAHATLQNRTPPRPSATTTPAVPAQPGDPSPPPSTPPQPGDTTPATPDGPAAVVQAYFDAINAHDYQRAWALGGKNIGQPYPTFASGFATTDHDVLTIQSTQGNTVTADLTAVQTDGTSRTFHGTYTVTGGTITHFSVRPTT